LNNPEDWILRYNKNYFIILIVKRNTRKEAAKTGKNHCNQTNANICNWGCAVYFQRSHFSSESLSSKTRWPSDQTLTKDWINQPRDIYLI